MVFAVLRKNKEISPVSIGEYNDDEKFTEMYRYFFSRML